MLSNCLLGGELALDGDSEELILIRLCWKTWLNLLTEVGVTCPWIFHSVNAKFQDTCFLGMILLYCLYEKKTVVQ